MRTTPLAKPGIRPTSTDSGSRAHPAAASRVPESCSVVTVDPFEELYDARASSPSTRKLRTGFAVRVRFRKEKPTRVWRASVALRPVISCARTSEFANRIGSWLDLANSKKTGRSIPHPLGSQRSMAKVEYRLRVRSS